MGPTFETIITMLANGFTLVFFIEYLLREIHHLNFFLDLDKFRQKNTFTLLSLHSDLPNFCETKLGNIEESCNTTLMRYHKEV